MKEGVKQMSKRKKAVSLGVSRRFHANKSIEMKIFVLVLVRIVNICVCVCALKRQKQQQPKEKNYSYNSYWMTKAILKLTSVTARTEMIGFMFIGELWWWWQQTERICGRKQNKTKQDRKSTHAHTEREICACWIMLILSHRWTSFGECVQSAFVSVVFALLCSYQPKGIFVSVRLCACFVSF